MDEANRIAYEQCGCSGCLLALRGLVPKRVLTEKDCPLDSWMTQEKKIVKIVDLETSHLANIVALLLRTDDNPQRSKIISLKKELVKRLSA